MIAIPSGPEDRRIDDTNSMPSRWTRWLGGDCPVAPHAPVQIRLGAETAFDESQPIRRADTWRWDHSPRCHRANITHFRVVRG